MTNFWPHPNPNPNPNFSLPLSAHAQVALHAQHMHHRGLQECDVSGRRESSESNLTAWLPSAMSGLT